MIDYQITKLIANKSIYNPRPIYIGSVEIKTDKYDLSDERNALEESIRKNNEDIKLDYSVRLTTIISSKNIDEAISVAENLFEEVLDILSEKSPISKFELKKSGFYKNLLTNKIQPIISKDITFNPLIAFMVDCDNFPGINISEYIYYNRKNILNQRYLNALHWSRLARWENNYQLKILFNWFSIESLIKIDENDDIIPKIMLSIGLPIGKKCQNFNDIFLKKLTSYPEYKSIRNNILKEFNKIKRFRNKSVHKGFRKFDLEIKLLKKYSYLVNMGKVGLFSLALSGIINRLKDEVELWEKAVYLYEHNNNSINYCHNNFLFAYTKGMFD